MSHKSDEGYFEQIPGPSKIFVERDFPFSAVLAKFTGNTSSDPMHLQYVYFTTSRAGALHLGFDELFSLVDLILHRIRAP
jgi:hypothetical protein